jgi:hypothetical protein
MLNLAAGETQDTDTPAVRNIERGRAQKIRQ